jgi:hypothetical protein
MTPPPLREFYQRDSHLCWEDPRNRYLQSEIALRGSACDYEDTLQALVSRRADTKVSTILSSNCSSPKFLF